MKIEQDNYFKRQALQCGGFCDSCGEGVEPILSEDIETFGLCLFGGNHLKLRDKIPVDK